MHKCVNEVFYIPFKVLEFLLFLIASLNNNTRYIQSKKFKSYVQISNKCIQIAKLNEYKI
jgi:hypothetical protein